MSDKSDSDSVIEFLNKSSNSLIREELLNYKLFYDLKLASARKKRYLKIYKPEVDIEGCDIIIEDNTDFARKIQLKSRVVSKTTHWDIHRSLLLPGMHQALDYGFEAVICPTTPGAFILIDMSESIGDIKITYSYTDINIITLMAFGYIKRTSNSQVEALNVLKKLKLYNKKIAIKENLLIQLKSPDSIIMLAGFLNNYDFVNNVWKLNQIRYRFADYCSNFEPYNVSKDYLDKLDRVRETGLIRHSEIVLGMLKEI
jgi:hypothetical protein